MTDCGYASLRRRNGVGRQQVLPDPIPMAGSIVSAHKVLQRVYLVETSEPVKLRMLQLETSENRLVTNY